MSVEAATGEGSLNTKAAESSSDNKGSLPQESQSQLTQLQDSQDPFDDSEFGNDIQVNYRF